MSTDLQYIFTSKRLGFRNWVDSDIDKMAEINSDKKVMAFFPAIKSKQETIEFIERMKKQFAEKGFCYFAVDTLDNNEFIGFIGLSEQTFESDFTPGADIGWRLKSTAWNKGYATEGATACLNYGSNNLSSKKIIAIAPKINQRSEAIMKKIGMVKVKEFMHPLLKTDLRLKNCVLHEKIN